LSDIDPTDADHALAAIAKILEQLTDDDAETPIIDEPPLARAPVDADGYSKVGPGPMAALRLKWTVNRGQDNSYYVQETIGERSSPIIDGPMTSEAAVKLVDQRARDAHHRFEVLRNEILGGSAGAEIAQKSNREP